DRGRGAGRRAGERIGLADAARRAQVAVVADRPGGDRCRDAGAAHAGVGGAWVGVVAEDRRVDARPGSRVAGVGGARVGVGALGLTLADRSGAARDRHAGVARRAGVAVVAGAP